MENKTFKDYKVLKKISGKENIFILEKGGVKYLLKKKINPRAGTKIISKLVDLLGLTNIHFNKELSVLTQMGDVEYKKLKYPKLVESDGASYLIMEYIEGGNMVNYSNENKLEIVSSLIDLQLSSGNFNFRGNYRIFSWMFNTHFIIFRRLVSGGYRWVGLKNTFIILTFLLKSELQTKKIAKPVMLHTDLGRHLFQEPVEGCERFHNLMFDSNGRVYFIDFGSVKITQKFILGDIIKLAFNAKDNTIDTYMLKSYLSLLGESVDLGKIKIHDEMKLYLIMISLNYLQYNQFRGNSYKFLNDIILDNIKFRKWIEESLK